MDLFECPTLEGAREVAIGLGVSAEEMVKCQDWEYTFPKLHDLPPYERLYEAAGTSDLAKRVLGCFIFQCLENLMRSDGSERVLRSNLARLSKDYHIHRCEFQYWALDDDAHYDKHPEDGWYIMNIVREYLQ